MFDVEKIKSEAFAEALRELRQEYSQNVKVLKKLEALERGEYERNTTSQ